MTMNYPSDNADYFSLRKRIRQIITSQESNEEKLLDIWMLVKD